jgi:hypothetical protein
MGAIIKLSCDVDRLGKFNCKPYSTQSSKNLNVNMGAIIKLSCDVDRLGEF